MEGRVGGSPARADGREDEIFLLFILFSSREKYYDW
jgi:hypothetical protein